LGGKNEKRGECSISPGGSNALVRVYMASSTEKRRSQKQKTASIPLKLYKLGGRELRKI